MYVNRQRNRVFFHHCISDAHFGTWSTLSPPAKKKKRITQKEEKKGDGKKAQYAAITITTAKKQLTSKPTQNEYTR